MSVPTGTIVLDTAMPMTDSVIGVGFRNETWPAWQRFKLMYLSSDGRVIDAGSPHQITTSRAQAYALFFALVANDRTGFDDILYWTNKYLSAGNLEISLPACMWGPDAQGNERVLDQNSAADADVWLSFALGEAARLWGEQRYATVAQEIAKNILRREVAAVPQLGMALLPGPQAVPNDHQWRLNAGYLPLPALRGIARQTNDTIWSDIASVAERIVVGSAPRGFVADWVQFTEGGFGPDARSSGMGAGDAIQAYLWAGMLPASDPMRDKLALALRPMLNHISRRAIPAASIDTETLTTYGEGGPGFSAALLPMLANAHLSAALQIHRQRAANESLQSNHRGYDDSLTLFGLGWLEQRFRFNRAGLLSVRWTPARERPH